MGHVGASVTAKVTKVHCENKNNRFSRRTDRFLHFFLTGNHPFSKCHGRLIIHLKITGREKETAASFGTAFGCRALRLVAVARGKLAGPDQYQYLPQHTSPVTQTHPHAVKEAVRDANAQNLSLCPVLSPKESTYQIPYGNLPAQSINNIDCFFLWQ